MLAGEYSQQVSYNEQADLGIFSALAAPLQPQVCTKLPRAFYISHLAAGAQRASRLYTNSMLSDSEFSIGRCIQTHPRRELIRKNPRKDSEIDNTEGWANASGDEHALKSNACKTQITTTSAVAVLQLQLHIRG
jgi:hypothetical protein